MRRDLIVFEHERFELTGYDVWMTAGEIATLFCVTIMEVRSVIRRIERDMGFNVQVNSRYELLENGYKDDQYNLQAIIAISYYVKSGMAYEFRNWICDRITRRKERAMIVYL